MPQVLILGGQGRIGQSLAADLLAYTDADLVLTGRSLRKVMLGDSRIRYRVLDLADQAALVQAIADSNLVIHCAGPFRYRDTSVLQHCIQQGVNYLDVSDDRSFTQKALQLREQAEIADVTAIVNTGVFPGISNSLVRKAVEQLDKTENIHLSYVVSGSGGSGVTVMRTTFLGLQQPFLAWINGKWQSVQPYSDRELIDLPTYGRSAVYWFDMPEAYTLAEAFPAQTVITKFGSHPDFYNRLTWMAAHWFPTRLIHQSQMIEFLAQVSHAMTRVSDRLTGIGVAMQATVCGVRQQRQGCYRLGFSHSHTATAAAAGTGGIAQFLLSGELRHPGVWSVEQALPTQLFEQASQQRGLVIQQELIC
ncbi:MAG: saccharopine dehydrogenase NADP-binding domain-containing protein [Pegethrix bostrychoides GSE-TBD4-15B]|uniref:Saccharopine dehydrogenase NADP-binding domain-containing protein n=1 Tax=Pegethrix bostrychoides GSE-TBD4-15B TaxID=2839662 RepID=A0A951P8I0_9CYAN|nr:saccharopine dehydrogenase NADP-binding domain-containing protein [Pegethrix bostrychoides GSE-TBD4-15B]